MAHGMRRAPCHHPLFLRQRFTAARAAPKDCHMLNVFTLANGRLFQEEIDSLDALTHVQPVWVDLENPSEEEKSWIEKRFALSIPKDAVGDDLEESARFYEEDNGELHIRSDFLIDAGDGAGPDRASARNVRVAFILSKNVLFSIHREDLPVFRLLRLRARRIPALIEDAKDVLLKLYDADAEYSADALEGIYDGLEKVSARVLTQDVNDQMAGAALTAIAREEDLNGRIRRNVMDTRRALSFMMRSRMLNAEQFEEARQILRDIDSLDSHTAFLFDKINFLMDATVGFININQNKIIKIFSVASVALLPPTLIASIYGMNFKFMPELDWAHGYPYALGLMLASVAAPFIYFRRKGWLR
jgi:magnesium transporter